MAMKPGLTTSSSTPADSGALIASVRPRQDCKDAAELISDRTASSKKTSVERDHYCVQAQRDFATDAKFAHQVSRWQSQLWRKATIKAEQGKRDVADQADIIARSNRVSP